MSEVYSEDDQRMIRLQAGDSHAFDEIVAEWQRPLFGFFIRNTRDDQIAEDLVQETLLRLYRRSWDYIPTGRFKGWLFRIAHNLLIDHSRRRVNDVLIRGIRRNSRHNGEEFDPLQNVAAAMISPQRRAEQKEVAEVVELLLQQLSGEQRETFLMHHYDALTLPEVADAMATSLPTTKSRLRLAKEKLRYLLSCRGFVDENPSEGN